MTRQQVAKRLGKSLATVRRLEGVKLRAVQDARGVHHFDPDEVEALAREIDAGGVTLWQELGPVSGNRDEPCATCIGLQQQVDHLQGLLVAQRTEHHLQLAALAAEHDREARELTAQLTEFLAMLND